MINIGIYSRRRHHLILFLPLMLLASWLHTPAAAKKIEPPESIGEWEARLKSAEEKLAEEWAVRVEDMQTGQIVYEYQPRKKLIPASNRKLIVMGMALDLLGTDFRFKTEFGLSDLYVDGEPDYQGEVILRSNGDPSLGPPFLKDPGNPAELFSGWARSLSDLGIAYVFGQLVIDASAFGEDQSCYPEVWDPGHENRAYAPLPSAIGLYQNLLRIDVRPAKASGQPGSLNVFPSASGFNLKNQTTTRTSGAVGISANFGQEPGELRISGRVRSGRQPEVVLLPLPDPLQYCADQMRRNIEETGITLVNGMSIRKQSEDGKAIDDPLARVIGRHDSPPSSDLLRSMSLRSDNYLAEQLWRGISVRVCGRGDRAHTREVEMDWYRRLDASWIEPGYDGSGLSRQNRNSPFELVLVARHIYESPYREYLLSALPVSGKTGTLRNRSFNSQSGRVIAKTGTLSGASALTGFILDKNGIPRQVFSIIGNAPKETNGRLSMRINDLIRLLIRKVDGTAYTQALASDDSTITDAVLSASDAVSQEAVLLN